MPWSSAPSLASAVLSKESAEKSVLEFVPVRFNLGTPEQAMNYLAEKNRGSDFRMNDAIRIQTGINDVEKISESEKVEVAALEKLKGVQEAAYKEAFQLGLDEGRKQAFSKFSADITEQMQVLDKTLNAMKDIKKELAGFNEAHLMKLVYQMASRIAKVELEGNNEAIVKILRDAVGLSQDEENITVRVSATQFEFLEKVKLETGREFEFTKRMKFEPSTEIADGGCIVETNYGEVDARIEQRLEQLWSVLSESLPKVKDKVAS